MTQSESDRVFSVGDECVVVIETTSGDVEVSGWDEGQVAVRALAERVNVDRDGATLTIRPTRAGSDDLAVDVPHQCDLTLRLVSGSATLRDVAGRISVETKSGDVRAKNLRGEAEVHTVSGDVSLQGCQLASLTIDTVSGDSVVESELDQGGAYGVHSVSGDFHLRVPEDQPCALVCRSLSGEIDCSLPHEIRRQGRGKVEALVNGGGVEFRVHTTSGDLKIGPAVQIPEAETGAQEPFGVDRSTKPPDESKPTVSEPFAIDDKQDAEYEKESAPLADQRMRILKAIEKGKMSVNEGLGRLRSLR